MQRDAAAANHSADSARIDTSRADEAVANEPPARDRKDVRQVRESDGQTQHLDLHDCGCSDAVVHDERSMCSARYSASAPTPENKPDLNVCIQWRPRK